eukprot:751235-Hanusia_phi.AAC.2
MLRERREDGEGVVLWRSRGPRKIKRLSHACTRTLAQGCCSAREFEENRASGRRNKQEWKGMCGIGIGLDPQLIAQSEAAVIVSLADNGPALKGRGRAGGERQEDWDRD